jgi:hypothetical protein
MKEAFDQDGLTGIYFVMITKGSGEQEVIAKGLDFNGTREVATRFVQTGSSWGSQEYRELSVCFLEGDGVFEIIRFKRGQSTPLFDYSADWLAS